MPGEKQGCVGCHEPCNGTPVIDHPLAALQPLNELVWPVAGFSCTDTVQPVLDRLIGITVALASVQFRATGREHGGLRTLGV